MNRSRIRPRNTERAAKARAEDFGSRERITVIAHLPCVCRGKHPACTRGFSEPSHVISRGAGGKADAIVPMSTGCHGAWHRGRESWLAEVGLTLEGLLALAVEIDATAAELLEALP